MAGVGQRWPSRAALVLLAASLAPLPWPTALAWTPPPPEFPDQSLGSGLDYHVHKWTPASGAPGSLLDVLPAPSPAPGDFNNDAFPDLFVPGPRYTSEDLNAARDPLSRLYMNDASTTLEERFLDVTDVAELEVRGHATGASWADVDNDGWLDLLVVGHGFARLFRNDGDSTFTELAAGLPNEGLFMGGAWGDYDGDGFVDLFLARFTLDPTGPLLALDAYPGASNLLLRNNGDGSFTDGSAAAGIEVVARRSTTASFVDVDGDGRLDVYVTNYGEAAESWRNNGDGTFTEQAAAAGLADGAAATCQSWEDLDRDGLLDLYVAHEAGVADGFFRARGDGTFEDLSGTAGLEVTAAGSGWGCGAFDYDADGDMDLLVAHGEPLAPMRQQNLLLTNLLETGTLAFRDDTAEAGDRDLPGYQEFDTIATPLASSGLAFLDWNLDRNLDLATSTNDGDRVRLFENMGWVTWTGSGHTMKAWLQGTAGNRAGLGALLTVRAGTVEVTRQLGAGMSWGSQGLADFQFGLLREQEGGYLGTPRPVSVTIQWPSGLVESYPARWKVNAMVRFIEGGGWRNDTAAPHPQFVLLEGLEGANGWYTSPAVTVRLTGREFFFGGSEASASWGMRTSLDGATWADVPNPGGTGVTLTFEGEGTHRLWVETFDGAGNRAVFLYPVRIDTQAPAVEVLSPAPGRVYAQGEEVARHEALGDRAVVVAPLGGEPGAQPTLVEATDATSGVASVAFSLLATGSREVAAATLALAPYEWDMPAGELPAGWYRLVTTVTDRAGHSTETVHRVVLVPSHPDGVLATLLEGPSVPPNP